MIPAITTIISLYSARTYRGVIREYGYICWKYPVGEHSVCLSISHTGKTRYSSNSPLTFYSSSMIFYNHRNLKDPTFPTHINTWDRLNIGSTEPIVYLPRWYVTYCDFV